MYHTVVAGMDSTIKRYGYRDYHDVVLGVVVAATLEHLCHRRFPHTRIPYNDNLRP